MFVVLLTYTAEIAEIDACLAAHVEWIKAGIADGRLLIAGRQVPRTGGVLIVRGGDRAEAEAWAATDPFVANGLATIELVEFATAFLAPELAALKE